MSDWCLIESDPAVFTEMVSTLGVKGVSVEEVVSLDESELRRFDNVYGLIFLFKWTAGRSAGSDGKSATGTLTPDAPVYFAEQTVTNACATVALVNTLCNYSEKVDLGENLGNFLAFTKDLDPNTRGQQIAQYEPLRTVHNSFAPPQTISVEDSKGRTEDAYHFVSFIYKSGYIWQLDGLQKGPVVYGPATDEDYKARLMEHVQTAINEISAKDTTGSGQSISFSLMAVVDDPLVKLQARAEALKAEEKPVPTTLREEIEDLEASRAKDRLANVRRRHNYTPTIVALLRALAEKGVLEEAMQEQLGTAATTAASTTKK